jgi:hypothetical protein
MHRVRRRRRPRAVRPLGLRLRVVRPLAAVRRHLAARRRHLAVLVGLALAGVCPELVAPAVLVAPVQVLVDLAVVRRV